MNTIIILTDGRKIDVNDVVKYSVDSVAGKPCSVRVTLKSGKIIRATTEDLDCIETFRRELSQIKHEE